MRLLFLLAGLLAVPLAARAECAAVPGGQGITVLSCPGGTSILQTDAAGNVTGIVGGQAFVGRQTAPGVIDGRLGDRPYAVLGGRAPDPPNLNPPRFPPVSDPKLPGLAPDASTTPLTPGLAPPPVPAKPSWRR